MVQKSRTARLLGIVVERPPAPRKPAPRQAARSAATAPPARRVPEPASTPATVPMPEKPLAKAAEPAKLRVLVIDPNTQAVAEAWLPAEPGSPGVNGMQPQGDALTAMIGSSWEVVEIGDGLAAAVDPTLGDADASTWIWGEDGEEMTGRAIVASYDPDTDTWSDAKLTVEEAHEAVQWGDEDDGVSRSAGTV